MFLLMVILGALRPRLAPQERSAVGPTAGQDTENGADAGQHHAAGWNWPATRLGVLGAAEREEQGDKEGQAGGGAFSCRIWQGGTGPPFTPTITPRPPVGRPVFPFPTLFRPSAAVRLLGLPDQSTGPVAPPSCGRAEKDAHP